MIARPAFCCVNDLRLLAVATPDADDAIRAALVALRESAGLSVLGGVSVGPAGGAVVLAVFLGEGSAGVLELVDDFTFAGAGVERGAISFCLGSVIDGPTVMAAMTDSEGADGERGGCTKGSQ